MVRGVAFSLARPLFQWRGFCRAAFVYSAAFLSADESPDAICRFLQTFDPRRVGKSKVPFRRVAAEVQSRCYRDTGGFEEFARETVAVVGQRTAICIDVKRPCGTALSLKPSVESAGARKSSADEIRPPLFEKTDGFRFECRQRSVLRRSRRR